MIKLASHPVLVWLADPEEENEEGSWKQLPDKQDHPEDNVAGITQSWLQISLENKPNKDNNQFSHRLIVLRWQLHAPNLKITLIALVHGWTRPEASCRIYLSLSMKKITQNFYWILQDYSEVFFLPCQQWFLQKITELMESHAQLVINCTCSQS